MAHLHERHFTVEEARQALARIRPLIEELPVIKQSLDSKGFDIRASQYVGGRSLNGDRYVPPEMDRLAEILGELDRLGVQVKGIDDGLVDFPHLRKNGEEVYLCFRAGETELEWWHPVEAGFAGRRPLSEL